MSKDKILMCPPDHFTVDYVINPWMAGHEDSLSLDKAKQQWQQLRDVVGQFAEIVTIDPQPDLPDMVFTANAGAVYGNKAIASHFIPQERRAEEPIFKQWFRKTALTCSTSMKNRFRGRRRLSARPSRALALDGLRLSYRD